MSVRKMCYVVAIVGLSGGLVAGCSQIEGYTGFGKKAQIGGAGGAAAGGLLAAVAGASPLGLAAGVILGGLAGGAIGNMLDNNDKDAALKAQQQSLENNTSGQATAWNNPDSGNSGSYTPTNTYQTQDGKDCRDFQQTITIDGKKETATGSACRMANGTWQVHNPPT